MTYPAPEAYGTYGENLRFLFKRFTYKVPMEGWKEGPFYVQKDEHGLCVRNGGEKPANFRGFWTLAPGETFSTKDPAFAASILKKGTIYPKTSIADAIDLAAKELKESDECDVCGKVLTIGDWPTCPHTGEGNHATKMLEDLSKPPYTSITIDAGGTLEAGDAVFFTGGGVVGAAVVPKPTEKEIPPVEKPKGRFIKLK